MKLRLERLEERTLLAADISVVQVDGEPRAVGEEATRWIHVYSDEAAEVNVQSLLTNELENPRWRRFDTYGKEFGSVSDGGERVLGFPGVAGGQQIGDFNGDQVDDVLMRLAPTKYVVVYGGVEEGLDLRNLESLEVCEDACSHIGPTIRTPLPPVSSIQPPPEFQRLGDINGDGFEDIALTRIGEEGVSLAIVYGSPALKWHDTITIGELPTPHISIVDGASEINDVGDVNGDGLGDVVIGPWGWCCNWLNNFVTESAHLLHGSSAFEPNTRTSLDALLASDPLSQAHGKVERPASVGDFNGDGYADYLFESIGGQWDSRRGIELFFGSDHGKLMSSSVPDIGRDGLSGRRVFEAADDFNGDGLSDLLFSFTGSDCDCGASGRPFVTGGLQVVYGRPHDPSENSEVTNTARTVFLLDRQSPYLDALQPGFATFLDVDGDQFADIGFNVHNYWLGRTNGLIVIRGSETPKDIDFGHVYFASSAFDGHEVYGFRDVAVPSNSHFDLNADGITDFLRRNRVIIGDRVTGVAGAGDVDQNILVNARRSVTYEVAGTLKENAKHIETTVFAPGEEELLFANNVVSPREGVLLNVEITEQKAEGDQAELDISITNRGPHNAKGVRLSETLTDGLTDVTWHRSVQLFPDEIQLDKLDPGVGTSLSPTQWVNGNWLWELETFLSDGLLQRYFGTSEVYDLVGERVGSAGDLNSDGYDDIFVDVLTSTSVPPIIGQRQSLLFYGSPEFAESGFGSPEPRPVISAEISNAGDINHDGYDDTFDVDFSTRTAHITFGGPIVDGHEQTQGVIQFVFPYGFAPSLSPNAASGFDVNGDGIEDLLIGGVGVRQFRASTAYLILGRSVPNTEGTGDLIDTLDVPVGSTITYTIRGTKQNDAALSGTAQLHVDESQIDLESQVKVATLGPVTIPGDIDQDGTVGFADFLILSANFGQSPSDRDEGDLNGDQTVDWEDFLILSRNFGRSTQP